MAGLTLLDVLGAVLAANLLTLGLVYAAVIERREGSPGAAGLALIALPFLVLAASFMASESLPHGPASKPGAVLAETAPAPTPLNSEPRAVISASD